MNQEERSHHSSVLVTLTVFLFATSMAQAGEDPDIIRVIPDYEANKMTIFGTGFVDDKDQLEQKALGCNNCLPPIVRIGHDADPFLSQLTVESYTTESESEPMPKLDRPGNDSIVVELPDLVPGDYKLWVAQNHDTDSDSDSAIKKAAHWDMTLSAIRQFLVRTNGKASAVAGRIFMDVIARAQCPPNTTLTGCTQTCRVTGNDGGVQPAITEVGAGSTHDLTGCQSNCTARKPDNTTFGEQGAERELTLKTVATAICIAF